MGDGIYFEDFIVGKQFHGERTHVMTKDEIIAFAREFDPQPQHTDEVAARDTQFGELVASGWHTGGVSMRIKLDSTMGKVVGGVAGLGIENLRWPIPVKPGDELSVSITVLEARPSKSRPDKGIVRYRIETFNQRHEVVMEMTTAAMMQRRPA